MCLRLQPLPCSPDQRWWSSFLLIPFFSLYFSGIPVQQHPDLRAAVLQPLPWYGTPRDSPHVCPNFNTSQLVCNWPDASIDAGVLAEPFLKQRARASGANRTPTVRSSQLASRGIFASAPSGTLLSIHLMNSSICIFGNSATACCPHGQAQNGQPDSKEVFRFFPASTSDSEKNQNYAPPLSRTKKDRPNMTKVEIVSHIPGDHVFVSL